MALARSWWKIVASLLFLAYGFANEEAARKYSRNLWRDGPCSYDQFRCTNDKCISKIQFCDGYNNCGDYSDEQYCSVTKCPEIPPRKFCYEGYSRHHNQDRCIPLTWVCDDWRDCSSEADERYCDSNENPVTIYRISKVRNGAVRWILKGRNNASLSSKWGSQVARIAVAWYLGDQVNFLRNITLTSEMGYEVSLGLLSRIASKTLKSVSSSELAAYVNAFLVTCINPRRFYGMDLVTELRQRADASNETHPSVTLALCNAGDDISDEDVKKAIDAFWTAHRNYRTDIEALAILALSCAARQDLGLLKDVDLSELTSELKKKQYRNGTVESLKTTALVMQALYASERESDEEHFDEEKALKQILKSQTSDGSFGNTVNTYYVLPVLAYRSLVNISSSHCTPPIIDEMDRLQDLLNLIEQKSNVQFSVWIGNNKTLRRTVTLKVPSNTSFYGVMEWAAQVDTHFRFEYSMRERKPYIYSISGIQDDPENSQFWFLHSIDSTENDDRPTLITKSPVDVFPTNGQHLVFWYKRG